MGVAQKIAKLNTIIILTTTKSNKLDRINNIHHPSTNYNNDELTTNSVTVIINRLINTFVHIYIVKDKK